MSENLTEFRAEVRAWLEANCPEEMRKPVRNDSDKYYGGQKTGSFSSQKQELWFERMRDRGWIVPDWPIEYGGAGLTSFQANIVREEMARINARAPIQGMGLSMFGPALLKFGTEEQKARFLPGIARGEIRWCQGFSEPGAGSDLASLSTRAEDRGDHWIVNGQKVWTTFGNLSDWMFALVRTDSSGVKHHGISFVVFDLATPGVTVKPIRLISGKSPFCETFLEDVQVPKSQLIGELHKGWDVAKYLLTHERGMLGTAWSNEAPSVVGAAFAKTLKAEPGLRARVAEFDVRSMAFESAYNAFQDEAKAGISQPEKSSLIKFLGTELNKQRFELMMEASGTEGLFWEGPGYRHVTPDAWLRTKGNSIEGGTSEIQLNIIAKRVLGLPSK